MTEEEAKLEIEKRGYVVRRLRNGALVINSVRADVHSGSYRDLLKWVQEQKPAIKYIQECEDALDVLEQLIEKLDEEIKKHHTPKERQLDKIQTWRNQTGESERIVDDLLWDGLCKIGSGLGQLGERHERFFKEVEK